MSETPQITRRTLVKGLTLSSLLPALGANLVGCSDASGPAFDSVPASFGHGVASGDPLADRVILWSRLTPEREGRAAVEWEVSSDAGFTDIVASGAGATDASVDYTVKVDAEGLQPGSSYYYRFRSGDTVSPTGRTRTLPEGMVGAVSFAVVSCSNYPAGFFNVYREVAQRDVDAVLHLGDYLYEYAADGYASARAEEFGRVSQPPGELLTLADYRTRYAQYHGDEDLQAAHGAHPFIIVWDDHEVANNAWRDGAQNHDPATEGSFVERKRAAIQAWYEWLPVRPPTSVDEVIYRRFRYGDLVDLFMLDTRIVGRDEQNTYSEFVSGGMIDVEAARAAFGDPARSLLGEAQRDWLREELGNSTARWQVLGQQVLSGRYHLPAPIMEALDPSIGGDALAAGAAAAIQARDAKRKAPSERSADEQALLDSAIPYNLDAWDGYEYERDTLLAYAADMDLKLVMLAGDTHNVWNGQLTTPDARIAGVEFGCSSVSSPGLEEALPAGGAAFFEPLATELIDDLVSVELSRRGYLHLRLSPDRVEASHYFVDTIDSRNYVVDAASTIEHSVNRADMLLT
ncbi:MAG: alkaline phosphatase D family protein [Halioglobus sp.]|nr:alkaline phosphatase D family protein [Halioglobus sp.]